MYHHLIVRRKRMLRYFAIRSLKKLIMTLTELSGIALDRSKIWNNLSSSVSVTASTHKTLVSNCCRHSGENGHNVYLISNI